MAYGKEIYWSVAMIVMIPVILGALAQTFNAGMTKEDIEAEAPDAIVAAVNFIDFVTLGLFSYVFQGYTIFPYYVSIFLVVIPFILLGRGIVSL